MSKVPAWKRLGLSVKKDVIKDELNTTEHLGDAIVTNKLAKKLTRSYAEDQNKKEKKIPKRRKLPKAERKAPPEKDQLAYLKQFSEDRDNWKFSKQKQNWLLKNIDDIPSEYDLALRSYFDSIQGGARQRLENRLRDVVNEWNIMAKKLEEKIEAELFGDEEENEKKETIEEIKDKKKAEEAEQAKGPSREYALKCKSLLEALLDDPIALIGAEDSVVDGAQLQDDEIDKEKEDHVEQERDDQDNLIIEEVDVEQYVNVTEGSSRL